MASTKGKGVTCDRSNRTGDCHRKPSTATAQPARLAVKISVIASFLAPFVRLVVRMRGTQTPKILRRKKNAAPISPICMWLFVAPSFPNFRQHFPYPQQVVAKDLLGHVQQLEDSTVRNRIKHPAARFPRGHQISSAKNGQLLRDVGLFNPEDLA